MFVAVYPINHLLKGIPCTAVQVALGIVVYGGLLLVTKDEIVYMLLSKFKKVVSRG